jgi:hypothetical protein
MGHISGITARCEHRDHIRFQRIANHQAPRGARTMPVKNTRVDMRCFVRNNFDRVKMIAQARLRQLALLIQ